MIDIINSFLEFFGAIIGLAKKEIENAINWYWHLLIRYSIVCGVGVLFGFLMIGFGQKTNIGALASLGNFLIVISIALFLIVSALIRIGAKKLAQKSKSFEDEAERISQFILAGIFFSGIIYFTKFWRHDELFMLWMFILIFLATASGLGLYTFKIKWLINRGDIIFYGLPLIGTLLAVTPEPILYRISLLKYEIPGMRVEKIEYNIGNIRDIEFMTPDGKPILSYIYDENGCPILFRGQQKYDTRTGQEFRSADQQIRNQAIACAQKIDRQGKEEKVKADKEKAKLEEKIAREKREKEKRDLAEARNLEEKGRKSKKAIAENNTSGPSVNNNAASGSEEKSGAFESRLVTIKSIKAVIESSISSDSARIKDRITARIVKEAEDNDKSYKINQGSNLVLEIIEISKDDSGTNVIFLQPVTFRPNSETDFEVDSNPIKIGRKTNPFFNIKSIGGAVAGAVIGKIFSGNRGAVIGGSAGYSAGAAIAVMTQDREIIIPKGFPVEFKKVLLTVREPL